jgi:hypothetical protein
MFGPHELIGDALFLKGDYKAAMIEYEKEPSPTARLWGRAAIFHIEGKKSESDAAIHQLIEKHANWGVYIAILFALRGDNDRAFEWLHKAITTRDSTLATIHQNLWLNSLHKDPRWLPFLRKIGKAPEQLAAIKFELKVPKH